MEFVQTLKAGAVVVPAQFITDYMAKAGGDYVKVYLYLLNDPNADIEEIAEALKLSEGDVRRAVKYWHEEGVIIPSAPEGNPVNLAADECRTASAASVSRDPVRDRYRSTEGTDALLRLSGDQEFKELTFIVQKYRSKIMDEKESQVMAYLYDGLHLSADVIEYLVAYAVEHDRNDIRYIEKLGKDWAKLGIKTVKEAKRRTKQFEKKPSAKAAKGQAAASVSEAKTGRANARATDYDGLVLKELLKDLV